MSVSFDIYRIGHAGERILVHSTQSAREAREVRDAGPGEMQVVGRRGRMDDQQLNECVNIEIETQVQ
jgi:hypothetical protein